MYWSTWYTHSDYTVGNVANYNLPGTDRTPFSDFNTGYDCRTCANPGTFTNLNVATQCGMRRNVNVIVNTAFVIHRGSGIYNAMSAYYGVRLDYSPLHHC